VVNKTVESQVDGAIGWVTLNRPERHNALNFAMWQALGPVVEALAHQPKVKAIVVRGKTAEAFAAGADISEFAMLRHDTESAQRYDAAHAAALAALRDCAKPTIAMIEGYCIGGGLAIALACDLRYAGPTAQFSLPPAKLGLAYPLDSLRDLLAALGADTAKEMLFTARRYGAQEAEIMGLITACVEAPAQHVRNLVVELAANAPLTLHAAKAAVNMLTRRSRKYGEREVEALANACFDSEDYAEGQRAFAEKRKPLFKGR
jgi:enoyl-CoA hydratase